MGAIASVFTIGYVANLLGKDEEWLHKASIDMFPQDGRLQVYGVGADSVTAFTEDSIEKLRQVIAEDTTGSVDEFPKEELQWIEPTVDFERVDDQRFDREWLLAFANMAIVPAVTTVLAVAAWLFVR